MRYTDEIVDVKTDDQIIMNEQNLSPPDVRRDYEYTVSYKGRNIPKEFVVHTSKHKEPDREALIKVNPHDGILIYLRNIDMRDTLLYRIIRLSLILVAILLGVPAFRSTEFLATNTEIETVTNTPPVETQNLISADEFLKTGFVFPDSNTRLLDLRDLSNLENLATSSPYTYRDFIRFGIDEIYARHGYVFRYGSVYDKFYNSYDWYLNTPKATVDWSDFNLTEQKNLNLLVKVEEENGWR